MIQTKLTMVELMDIPCYGIEPTHGTAQAARKKGIEILEIFFGEQQALELLNQGRQADLIVANNVLAHVPDINDFVKGFSILLKPNGVATFEFPHLLNLVNKKQFDTIYHEHYSYLSLVSVKAIFEANGLDIFDVEELPTHGGSLRIYAQRSDIKNHVVLDSVGDIYEKEVKRKVNTLDFYRDFQRKSEDIKFGLLSFLIEVRLKNQKVILTGFINHPSIKEAGASPDGLVGEDGLIEIKCLNIKNHNEIVKKQTLPKQYNLQIQFQLACTKRAWCDFVAYHPESDHSLYVKRVLPDVDLIKNIHEKAIIFVGEVEEKYRAMKERNSEELYKYL